MSFALRVDGLSKEYVLGGATQRHDTFYDLLAGLLRRPIQRFRSLGGQSAATHESRFWALNDVSFAIDPGEVVGIVGRNGAGKSTLLKILSRITEPTRGRVQIRGRVASLLEVGTGFHPELTGRENIFLNGAILGMTRSEIRSRFDEIIAFAEVEKFLDTPIKRYSSGMYVRLAFAVAAHLEPDVLVVDEVLAVGDAQFQRKSLGKMEDVARLGRTVLLVSHNLGAVRNLCRSVLLFESGRLRFQGAAEDGLSLYEHSMASTAGSIHDVKFQGPLSDRIRFEGFALKQAGEAVPIADPAAPLEIELRGKALRAFTSLDLNIWIFRDGFHLSSCHDAPFGRSMREGAFTSRFCLPAGVLRPGRYSIGAGAVAGNGDWTWASEVGTLDLAENWGDQSAARDRGVVRLAYEAERVQ